RSSSPTGSHPRTSSSSWPRRHPTLRIGLDLGPARLRELDDLRDVQRAAPDVALLDLGLAREPVRDDERVRIDGTDLREQDAFGTGQRDVVMAGLVAPG